jgi:hypothetical protein
MKKIFILCAAVVVIMSTYSCTKLDVPVESQYVKSNFPVTDADYNALLGYHLFQSVIKLCGALLAYAGTINR